MFNPKKSVSTDLNLNFYDYIFRNTTVNYTVVRIFSEGEDRSLLDGLGFANYTTWNRSDIGTVDSQWILLVYLALPLTENSGSQSNITRERFISPALYTACIVGEMKKLFQSLWRTLQVGCSIINWGILMNFSFDQKSMRKSLLKCYTKDENAIRIDLSISFNLQVESESFQWSWSLNGCHTARLLANIEGIEIIKLTGGREGYIGPHCHQNTTHLRWFDAWDLAHWRTEHWLEY